MLKNINKMIKVYCDKCGKEITKGLFNKTFDALWNDFFKEEFPQLCDKCKKKYSKHRQKFFKES